MYKRGEIVLVPVPFSNLTYTKKRPVLVISNTAHNFGGPDMIVVAITSDINIYIHYYGLLRKPG